MEYNIEFLVQATSPNLSTDSVIFLQWILSVTFDDQCSDLFRQFWLNIIKLKVFTYEDCSCFGKKF